MKSLLPSHLHRRKSRASQGRFVRNAIEPLEGRLLFALTGQYYDNVDFTNLKTTRTDAQVDFTWGTGSPATGVSPGTYSVRWTGSVQAQYSEMYTFYVLGADGYRLWINNQLVLNNFVTQSATETSGQIALQAGQSYNLRLEYFDNTSSSRVSLSWSSPSTPKAVIPAAQLSTASVSDSRGAVLAETWSNLGGSSILNLKSNNNFIANLSPSYRQYLYSLESAGQNSGIYGGVKVRGYIVPDTTGTYRFAISGSTDAQFNLAKVAGSTAATRIAYTSGATAFRDFAARPSIQQSVSVTLTAGQAYYFEVWQKATAGSDHFSVAWQTPWNASSWTVVDGQYLSPVNLNTAAPANSTPYANLFGNASTGHGRILATNANWAKARALIAQGGQFGTYRDNILAAAATSLTDPLPTYSSSTTQSTLQALEIDLVNLAAAYKLTGDTQYADAAWAQMEAALSFTTWDGGNQALGYGMGGNGIAVAYDWMYDYLAGLDTSTDATLNGAFAPQWIADRVNTLIIQPCISTLKNANYWVPWQNNWSFVVAGGAISAALAVAPYYTAATSELIARAIPQFTTVIDRTMDTNAGGSEEGPGYNTYGGVYLVKAIVNMVNTLGTDYGISSTPGFSQWANFMFGQYANNYNNAMVSFAEGQWTGIFEPWNFYFATRFARTDTAWFIRQKLPSNSADPLTLLWWDDRGTNPAVSAYRTDLASVGDQSSYKSEEVYTTRQTWADSNWDDPMLFFKGGYFDNRHDYLDAGTWNYDSQGKRWFPVLYHQDYSLPGYDQLSTSIHPNRWDYYNNRAEAHNTLVINASSAADQVPGSDNVVIRSLSNSAESTSIVDLTPANANQPVSRVWRGFRFDKRTGMATIQDEITPTANLSTVDWYANYNQADQTPVFSNANRDVVFTQGSAKLYMRIISPAGAAFDVQDATSAYLTAANTGIPSSTLNAYSGSYDRLHIRLNNVSAFTTLTVAIWGNWGVATPPFPTTTTTALSAWFPRTDHQVWIGDIDQGRAADAANSIPVDTAWAFNVLSLTGRQNALFESTTLNRTVPFTFTTPVSSGENITAGKLVLSLKSNAANSNTDTLYFNTSKGTLSYAFNSSTLAWATVDSTLGVREVDLSKLKYADNTTLLAAVTTDKKLNVALSGNVFVDWAQLSYDKYNASGVATAVTIPGITTTTNTSFAISTSLRTASSVSSPWSIRAATFLVRPGVARLFSNEPVGANLYRWAGPLTSDQTLR
jgi:hypothetical protein